jgi:hypothetical protein
MTSLPVRGQQPLDEHQLAKLSGLSVPRYRPAKRASLSRTPPFGPDPLGAANGH